MTGALALAALLSAASPAGAHTSRITPAMDQLIRAGIDDIYRMQFDRAEADFRKLLELAPGHPFGSFGLCSAAWAKFVYGADENDPAISADFERRVRDATASAQAWVRKDPQDAEALMALGAIQGILSRLLLTRHQYLRAYVSGRTAIKSVRDALAIDPELADARLGLGMYEYYTDLYPRMIRMLTKAILRGDRMRGIANVKLAAAKGRYMSITAKMILVEIYTNDPFGAKDPAAAVKLMEEVRARYPESPMLHSAQLLALYEAGRKDELHREAAAYLAAAQSGKYPPLETAKGHAALAAAFWSEGRKEEALAEFRKGGEAARPRSPTRWPAWSLLRGAQAADELGRRAEAIELYRRVLALKDPWGFGKAAQAGLLKPYHGNGDPPPLMPPS
ncbi:MAG TPA: hypothetical protein VNI01_01360 [Elusimicrobiota bacterium]|jgi:tetratricopeptide (TPR) repeat protein|nr:hypothetical protein [Elusimicrobiota bacterium]